MWRFKIIIVSTVHAEETKLTPSTCVFISYNCVGEEFSSTQNLSCFEQFPFFVRVMIFHMAAVIGMLSGGWRVGLI